MAIVRKPIPGKDEGQWGKILNDFLDVSHKSDGTLKDGVVGEDSLSEGVKDKLANGVVGPQGPQGPQGIQGEPGTTDYNELINKPALGTAAFTPASDYATATQGTKADTAVQPAAIADFETSTELDARDTANRARANHTGTQAISTVSGLQAALNTKQPTGDYTTSTQLAAGLATKADSAHNHTLASLSEKSYNSLTNKPTLFNGAYSSLSGVPSTFTPSAHTHGVEDINATGTADSTTYLRGDDTWATPTNTTYTEISSAEITTGTASTARTISGRRAQEIVNKAVSSVDATRLASGMGVVVHGASASATRPTGYAQVTWIGTVEPTNATTNDIWYNG